MAKERYALVFWIEDEQYSVVKCKDTIGEVEHAGHENRQIRNVRALANLLRKSQI